MKKLFLLMILTVLVTLGFSAVSSGYSFNYSAGTYTAITGGTVLATGTTDDTSYNANNIGFTFTYNGTAYTQFSVNANGFLALGASVINSYSPISSGSTNNIISAVGRDLQGNTDGELRYQLLGTSPNQYLVMQWKSYRRYGTTGENYNFQIILYETSNKVEVVYGTMTVNYTGTLHPQVGVRGASSADYNNRATTTDWAATTAGTSNSATCTLTTTVYPASGTTYAWTVNPINPEPTNHVTNFSYGTLGYTSIQLAWTGSTGTQLPQFYLILGKTGAGTYAAVADGTPVANDAVWTDNNFAVNVAHVDGQNSYVVTGLTANTSYDFIIYPYTNDEANIDFKTDAPVPTQTLSTADPTITVFPHTESFDGTMFAPDGWLNVRTAGTGTPGIWDRQTVGTSPTVSAPYSGAGMARYNCYSLSSGTTGTLITRPLNFTSDAYRVNFWMYRDIASYQTSADRVNVYYNTAANTTGATLLGTINRACGLAPIVTVEGWYNYIFNMPTGAAGDGRYIIFEAVSAYGNNIFLDHVVIEEQPTTGIFTINPTATTWDFGSVWINVPATKTYTITNTGGAVLTINSVVASGTYYSISDNLDDYTLDPDQSETFTVQFLPTAEGGPYTGSVTVDFTRATHVIDLTGSAVDPTIYYADLPYPQNFDGVTVPALPWDWSTKMIDTSTFGYVRTVTTNHSAPNSVGLYNSSDIVSDKILISPPIDPDLNTLRVRFWLYGPIVGGIQVGTVDVAGQSAVFTNFQTVIPAVSSTWAEYTVNFSTYSGTDKYIAFRHGLGATYQYWYVDDVVIEEPPTVPIIVVAPTTWDFGNVDVLAPVTKVFTISNTGGADLVLSSVVANGTYYSISVPPATMTITPGNSTTFTVEFAPTVVGGPYAGDVTINDNRAQTVIPLTGNGIERPAGSTCGNPYDITLPLVDFPGDTSTMGDDYDYAWVDPNSYYINGNDMVFRFTLAEGSTLSGSLSSTGTWIGLFILQQEPNPTTPAPVLRSATTTGSAVTMTPVILGAGTYFAIVSSWPAPQSIAFTLNLSAVPLPTDPEFTITPPELTWDFGTVAVNTAATKVYTIQNTGGGTLTLDSVVASGDYYSISVPPADTELTAGESTTFTVQYAPTSVVGIPHTGTATVTYDGTSTHIISLTGSAVDYTIYPPYIQDFGTSTADPFPPNAGWARFLGLPGSTLTPITYGWIMDDWLNGVTTNKAAKVNIYGSSVRYWLRTAPVNFEVVADYELTFDMGLVEWNGTTQPPLGESLDDRLVVYVSDNADMTGATILREWNNTGSPDVYENIPAAGANYNIPLTGYSGIKYFAWYGESTISDMADNDLMVDNILVREIPTGPPDPVTLTYPADEATGLPQVGFNLTWSPAVTGGVPDYYGIFMSTDPGDVYGQEYWETTNLYFNPVTEGLLTFAYDEIWYWTVQAFNTDGDAVVDPAYRFTIQSDPYIRAIPYVEDFEAHGDNSLPNGWTRTANNSVGWRISADYSSLYWTIPPHTIYAASNDDAVNGDSSVDMLIMPPIDLSLTGATYVQLTFDSFYTGEYSQLATVEVSTDNGVTWSNLYSVPPDTDWATYSVMLTPYVSAPFMLRFHADDAGVWASGWAVDNVKLEEMLGDDVATLSIDMNEVYPVETIYPMATVINNGVNSATFDVTMTIGTVYTSTQTVSGLTTGMTQQVTFSPYSPSPFTADLVTVWTQLALDENTANDTLYSVLICLPLDTPGLAQNAQTDQFVQFNLDTPEILNPLPNGFLGTYFVSGADWVNGKWMGVEYDDGSFTTDNYLQIDPLTGLYTDEGDLGAALMGNAYNDNLDIMYGVTGTTGYLYQMNPLTGAIGAGDSLWYELNPGEYYSLANLGGLMISIVYDNFTDTLYGIDLGNDCLWIIDPATYELTLVGFLGIDINYAQDAAFDQENGLIFLAGYTNSGALYWIDTVSGGAYKVGPLGSLGYELTGFAIPYGLAPAVPAVTIGANGAVSWTAALGAAQYKIYASNDPYGTFVHVATVYGTSWTDPNFPEAYKFYKVTAVGGRTADNRQPVSYSHPLSKSGTLNQQKRIETGLAR